jgi:hypothetical protein
VRRLTGALFPMVPLSAACLIYMLAEMILNRQYQGNIEANIEN